MNERMDADQALANIARIQNGPVLDMLKNSVAAKRDGKTVNPEADVKSYFERKDEDLKKFFDDRLKSSDTGTVSVTQAQMRSVKDLMLTSPGPKVWQAQTKGWNKESLHELQIDVSVVVNQQRNFATAAASRLSNVNDPSILGVVAQNKDPEALRGALVQYAADQNQNIDGWTREARNKPALVSTAVIASPVAAVPASTVAPEPRLSSQDCKKDFKVAVTPKTVDPIKFAKDFASQPAGTQMDLSGYDKPTLRVLRSTLLQDSHNQKNMARQAGQGILAGNDPAAMVADIQNPEVRELIKNGVKPGMTPEQQTYLATQINNKIDGRLMEGTVAINNAMAAIDAQPRERTPVNKPSGTVPC